MATEQAAVVTLVRVVQTSSGCPSRRHRWDEEGNCYYLREAWGLAIDGLAAAGAVSGSTSDATSAGNKRRQVAKSKGAQ
jgi:hypothetical protein